MQFVSNTLEYVKSRSWYISVTFISPNFKKFRCVIDLSNEKQEAFISKNQVIVEGVGIDTKTSKNNNL